MLIHHWLLVLVDILFHSAIYVILFLNSAPLRETKTAASELAVYAIKMVSYPNINLVASGTNLTKLLEPVARARHSSWA